MADKLTPQQKEAVCNRGGKLLVSAAAGSGKTKVLVDRLMMYLTDPNSPADLDDFLIITYTKAAAAELRGKIAAKLTESIAEEPENRHLQKQMQRLFLTHISTVHGFCTNLLREYAYQLDLSADFRVADENECTELRAEVIKELLDRAYEKLGNDPDFCAFVDSQGIGRNDSEIPEIIYKVYDSARCHLNPDDWLDSCVTDTFHSRDVSQTPWGSYLIDRLFAFLDRQIAILSACEAELRNSAMDNSADNIAETRSQLQYLRDSSCWDEIVIRKNIVFGTLRFPKKNADLLLAERVKAARNACKKELERHIKCFTDVSSDLLLTMEETTQAARGLISLVRQFERDYQAAKKSRHVLDFSDLEQKTLDLLLGKTRSMPTAAAREIGRRFREILVDEYQDSNSVQDAIFTALSSETQNCFLVGDVKQSIYRFRLADPEIFLQKYSAYPNAEFASHGEGRKILLSHNFRSGPEIIEGINDVFSRCMSREVGGLDYGEAEALREGIPHTALPDPAVELYTLSVQEDAYAEEAEFTASRILNMLRDGTKIRDGESLRPVCADDIVILLRSPGSVGRYYQSALERNGIRCTMDGGLSILDTEEIGCMRSLLQTISNPRQDIPLLGTLASPLFGFTADDLSGIRSGNKKESFYDALIQSSYPKVKAFLAILQMLREEARTAPLTQLLERCIYLTHIDRIYGAMKGGTARKANIRMFFQIAAEYESAGLRTLEQFLEYLDTMEAGGLLSAGSSSSGSVKIMSIHKSKGLEFPVVFLCGLSRRFNTENLRERVLCDRELGLGLTVSDNEKRIRCSSLPKYAIMSSAESEDVSEEMRVLYVAMTRAKDRLVMVYSAGNLEKKLQDIACRLPFDNGRELCAEASCPGDWILIAAMQHTEAGVLHNLAGIPVSTQIGTYPWKIKAVNSVRSEHAETTEEKLSQSEVPVDIELLKNAISFRYPFAAATTAPSKQTATGRTGRIRSEESREKAAEPKQITHTWRKPSFVQETVDGRSYGTTFHTAMQFIRFGNCKDRESICAELHWMLQQGYLDQKQVSMLDADTLYRFFTGPIGEKLCSGAEFLREFKFSILDPAEHYGEKLEGEQVLLQGVVDCAILEPDGITVIDYKTDRVTEGNIAAFAARYIPQIETYANALERIFRMKVKEKYLYFVHLNRFESI